MALIWVAQNPKCLFKRYDEEAPRTHHPKEEGVT